MCFNSRLCNLPKDAHSSLKKNTTEPTAAEFLLYTIITKLPSLSRQASATFFFYHVDVTFLLILEHCFLHITGCFVRKDVLKCRSLKYLWETVSLHWTFLNLTALHFSLRMANSVFPRLLEFTFQVWGGWCHWVFSTSEFLQKRTQIVDTENCSTASGVLMDGSILAPCLSAQQNTSAE